MKTKSKSLSMHTDSARGFAGTLSSPANGGATPALMLARRALAAGLRSDEDHRRTSFNFIRKISGEKIAPKILRKNKVLWRRYSV